MFATIRGVSKFLPLAIIYLVCLWLYYPVFSVYFSQDDFFHFKASLTDGSLKSFINLFGFPAFEERGYAFYRPLTREGLYNIYYSLFGLDHIPFRIMSLVVHGINIFLITIFSQKLFNNKSLAYLSGLLFGISAINVGVIYYGAGGIETSYVTLFILLSVIFFEKFLFLSLLAFILALMSHEIGVITPILLLGLIYIKVGTKNLLKTVIKQLWSFGIILLTYLYLDFVQIGLKQTQIQYKPIFSIPQVANTVMWYFGWALGLPEMLIDFVLPGFKLNPNLMKYWGSFFTIIFPAFFVLLGVLFFNLITNKKLFLNKKILFLGAWFVIAITPVVLLPQHKFVHYLAPAMAGASILISYLIINSKKFVSIFFLSAFLILNISSIKLAEKTYWAINRGKIAVKLLQDIKTQYPTLPQGAIVFIKDDPKFPYISEDWGGTSKQAKFILNDQDAIQLLYKDSSLKTYYEGNSGIPKHLLQKNVFSIVAKLN